MWVYTSILYLLHFHSSTSQGLVGAISTTFPQLPLKPDTLELPNANTTTTTTRLSSSSSLPLSVTRTLVDLYPSTPTTTFHWGRSTTSTSTSKSRAPPISFQLTEQPLPTEGLTTPHPISSDTTTGSTTNTNEGESSRDPVEEEDGPQKKQTTTANINLLRKLWSSSRTRSSKLNLTHEHESILRIEESEKATNIPSTTTTVTTSAPSIPDVVVGRDISNDDDGRRSSSGGGGESSDKETKVLVKTVGGESNNAGTQPFSHASLSSTPIPTEMKMKSTRSLATKTAVVHDQVQPRGSPVTSHFPSQPQSIPTTTTTTISIMMPGPEVLLGRDSAAEQRGVITIQNENGNISASASSPPDPNSKSNRKMGTGDKDEDVKDVSRSRTRTPPQILFYPEWLSSSGGVYPDDDNNGNGESSSVNGTGAEDYSPDSPLDYSNENLIKSSKNNNNNGPGPGPGGGGNPGEREEESPLRKIHYSSKKRVIINTNSNSFLQRFTNLSLTAQNQNQNRNANGKEDEEDNDEAYAPGPGRRRPGGSGDNQSNDNDASSNSGESGPSIDLDVKDDREKEPPPEAIIAQNGLADVISRGRIDSVMYVYFGDRYNDYHHKEEVAGRVIQAVGGVIAAVAQVLTVLGAAKCVRKSTPSGNHPPVHLHIGFALLISNLLLLLAVHATEPEDVCTVVAMVLHYFHLVIGCWLFGHTVLSYVKLRKAMDFPDFPTAETSESEEQFDQSKRPILLGSGGGSGGGGGEGNDHRRSTCSILYACIAWTLPLPFILMSYMANPDGYETRRFCWMSIEKGMVLSFIVPVFILIGANTFLVVLSLRHLLTQRKLWGGSGGDGLSVELDEDLVDERKINNGIRANAMLLPLLACVWFLGVVALENSSSIFFQVASAIAKIALSWLVLYCLGDESLPHFWCCVSQDKYSGEDGDEVNDDGGSQSVHPGAHPSFDQEPLLSSSSSSSSAAQQPSTSAGYGTDVSHSVCRPITSNPSNFFPKKGPNTTTSRPAPSSSRGLLGKRQGKGSKRPNWSTPGGNEIYELKTDSISTICS